VVQDYYSDNEEMLAKLAAGASGYDLIVPTGNAVEALVRSRQLRPLDKSRLARLGNIKPEFMNAFFDPGNRYSVPYAYTVTLLGYNAEKLQALGLPTDTWALIFEPRYLQKLKGRVTVLDSQRELMAAALRYLGHSVNDTDEAKWKQARDLILRAKPYWAAFNASSYIKELTVGNIWLAHGYSNDMFQAKADAEGTGTAPESMIEMRFAPNQARFAFSGMEFVTKLVEGKFPDYNRVIPKNHKHSLTLGRAPLLASLQRAAILTSEKFKGVRVNLEPGVLRIASSNAEQEEAREELEVDYGGDPIEIGFNVTYLIDALSNMPQEMLRIDLQDTNSSALITVPDQPGFKYVVMPMRI